MIEAGMRTDFGAYSDCELCPHACGVDRNAGKLGRCHCDSAPRVSRAALHHWEEPPISGSSGSGTIFLSGCSLGCVYCQNREISRHQAGRKSDVTDIASDCMRLQGEGALNVNFVTPTHFSPHLRAAIGIAREWGLEVPIVWNTSGYESARQIEANSGFVDVYLTDFKYFDEGLSESLSGTGDYRQVALDALRMMVKTVGKPEFDSLDGEERIAKGVIVRHMMLPGHLDDSKRIVKLLFGEFGNDVQISLMSQYTPVDAHAAEVDPALARAVAADEYESLLDYADSLGLNDYHWQDGIACMESFIPDFDASG